jgi:hypothetical protein
MAGGVDNPTGPHPPVELTVELVAVPMPAAIRVGDRSGEQPGRERMLGVNESLLVPDGGRGGLAGGHDGVPALLWS